MKDKYRVVGPRIKVKIITEGETKSAGGLVLDLGTKDEDNETGIVVQLGNVAYGNFSENWCDVGDKVLFQRYAGKPKEEIEKDGSIGYYRLLKDIDVIAVLEEDKSA